MMKILGVDEAGRGAVIGPLVICGALIDDSKEPQLKELGVRDSKLIAPKKRGELAKELEKILNAYKLIGLPAEVIDMNRINLGVNLNELEMQNMSKIINELKPDKAYLDAVDSNIANVYKHLDKYLEVETDVVAEHGADNTYPIVSAASIIAKVTRDSRIEELKKEYGELGSGYPSDPTTKTFLSDWFKENKSFPKIVRKSWLTVSEHIKKEKQKSLGDFI